MKYRHLQHLAKQFRTTTIGQSVYQGERRFRLMADSVPQIVWITDSQGRTEFFNRQWRQYTGIQFNPATAAETAAAAVHPDDVAITMERFNAARRSGTSFEVEHRIRSAAGQYRWFIVRAEPYRDPDTGAIVQWFGASVDIHDRRQAEEALHLLAARQRFQLALADRIRPLADPDSVIAAASELLGTELGAERVFYCEVAGPGFAMVQPDWTAGTLPSMTGQRLRLSDFGALIIAEVEAGRTLAINDVTLDEKSAESASAYLAKGVRSFVAIPVIKQGRLRATLNVHRSQAHQWSGLELAMAQDMVDRTWAAVESVRAQAKMRTERDRSRSVFDGMTEGFALFARNWTLLEMNEEGLRISGRVGAEVAGKRLWDIWPEMLGTEDEHRYRRIMHTREPETWESCRPSDTGAPTWIEMRAYPAGGDELAIFFRDITERKIADQKLKDADRRKDEFLAMLAHELRNPLAPIGAAARLLQIGQLDDAGVRRTSHIISRQVGHMTHLIDDLLDVSRVTRGLVELEKGALDIRDIVVDAVEQVTPLIQARHHHLTLQLPPQTTMVLGDKKRLVQVLTNILNNAAKYTLEGGNILLRTDVRETHVMIQVTDNGIGMASDLAAHAFDLFAQAERSSDRSGGGLGLGLALVKNLMALHGGTVTCSSEGIGKGSSFSVCLPRIDVPRAAGSESQAPTLPLAAQALRIAVVDDNVDAADMLGLMLRALGHDVVISHDAHGALGEQAGAVPDVFLLDIGLPQMDGNELARQLRAQPRTASAVLIAVTGYGQETDRQRTREAGFDHHLVKPVDLDELSAILNGVKAAAPVEG
ncbi:PAS domain S-box protein [Massilia sp. PAMC28688]|uniref:hybrid sensor histidine kinase/response regulator n=1 Tax=Massilia sp. PAMC28688 TaxID=2861283 RepID=UPI001C63A56B|nr:ATP-binding protein [Massilia sp. PAMC28688]QYF94445.1 PAS domain S-box protein [Massilia sp. PAMC28688]